MVTGKCTDVFKGIFFGLGGRVEVGGVMWEDLSTGKLLMGEGLSMKWAQDFSALFKKKQRKNKYEKFFLLKVRSSIKT